MLLLGFLCSFTALKAQHYNYPIPPDSIADRSKRAGYMALNFWTDSTAVDSTLFVRPKLLQDYIFLLKQSDEDTQHESVKSFVGKASKSSTTFSSILYWLDLILYDSSSRFTDETMYLEFMQAVMDSEADEILKIVPAARIELLKKNRVGFPATDFVYYDRAGNKQHLYNQKTPLILLLFNNPDCSLCRQAEKNICDNDTLQKFIVDKQLTVLAITPDADAEEWKKHVYPMNWLTGYDKGDIYKNHMYDIPQFPCFYLLEGQKKQVLLKKTDYQGVCDYISKQYLTLNH